MAPLKALAGRVEKGDIMVETARFILPPGDLLKEKARETCRGGETGVDIHSVV